MINNTAVYYFLTRIKATTVVLSLVLESIKTVVNGHWRFCDLVFLPTLWKACFGANDLSRGLSRVEIRSLVFSLSKIKTKQCRVIYYDIKLLAHRILRTYTTYSNYVDKLKTILSYLHVPFLSAISLKTFTTPL